MSAAQPMNALPITPAAVRNPNDRATLRFLAAPTDADTTGRSVQAGRVLEWIDKAGFACAAGWSASYCVTAYVGNVHFSRPIRPGDLIETHARIIHTGRTSMQVLVTVSAGDPTTGDLTPATDCLLVFVAVDAERKPRPVPQWAPRTLADLDLTDRAHRRIQARADIRRAMLEQEYTDAGTTPRMVFRFLAAPADVNWGGNVHGGTVMRWIDETAHACALGWTKRPTLAIYTGGIHFQRPVHIGHLVEVDARIIHTTGRSLHIAVRVRSADPTIGDWHQTTQCMSVFVVPGQDGVAEPVAQIPLVSDEDVRLDAHARDLIRMRAELDAIGVGDLLDA